MSHWLQGVLFLLVPLCGTSVKEKIAVRKEAGLLAEIADLHLKSCIFNGYSKDTTSGRKKEGGYCQQIPSDRIWGAGDLEKTPPPVPD